MCLKLGCEHLLEIRGYFLRFFTAKSNLEQTWGLDHCNFMLNLTHLCCNCRKWGFEKLVYRDVKTGIRRDRKYAVQPRNVFATGVHMSQNIAGKTTHKTEGRIKYYHYHGTISDRREPCRQFLNVTTTTVDGIPYIMDTTMRGVAPSVKRFELKMIGPRLQRTRQ